MYCDLIRCLVNAYGNGNDRLVYTMIFVVVINTVMFAVMNLT